MYFPRRQPAMVVGLPNVWPAVYATPLICIFRHVTWQPPIDPEAKIFWRQAGNTGAVGLEIAVALTIGYFGGQYLDGKFATTPWLTWIGFVIGIGAGIKALVRVSRRYAQDTSTTPDSPPNPPQDSHKDSQ